MSAKVILGAMIAASVLAVASSSRWERQPKPPAERPRPEAPWLTPEAAAQIVGADGRPGPLFEGVELGGSPPSPAVRAKIAAFARAHKVDIHFEIANDELAAVRLEVEYGGCCGYEGADVFALRLRRPHLDTCCGCGDKGWHDDWTFVSDGVHGTARVRVNRVTVRWEKELTTDELVERADRLVGGDRFAVAKAAGDRWVELEPHHRYLLQTPYGADRYMMDERQTRGIEVVVDGGRIVESSFSIRDDSSEGIPTIKTALRSRWGRPQVHNDGVSTWYKRDRLVVADADESTAVVTVRTR